MSKGWIKYIILIIVIFLAGAKLDTNKELSYEYIKGPGWQETVLPAKADKVNINIATAEELDELDDIGKALAERIIEYREKHPFTDTSQLKNVSGIGDAKFNAIKDKIEI